MKRKISLILAAAFLLAGTFLRADTEAAAVTRPAAEAAAECAIEVSSRRILHEKQSTSRLPMASTTKILTAAVILKDCDLSASVEIPPEAEAVEGSRAYLKAGEHFTVEELLYGLMLRSGNDCAVALALHHSGSLSDFAGEMTRLAHSVGAEESRFANPHGLPAEGHFTTARDLALISAYAMTIPKFREIVSCRYYAPRGWRNKNKLLTDYEGANGIKTGFTTAAGRCLVASAEREGMTIVSVLLNCPTTYERTAEILDGCFSDYNMIPLCDPSAPFEGYAVKYAFAYPLTEEEFAKIRIEGVTTMPEPTRPGEVAGQMMIYLENSLLFSQNLYMM